MASNGKGPATHRRRGPRSYREQAEESDASDSEPAADAVDLLTQRPSLYRIDSQHDLSTTSTSSSSIRQDSRPLAAPYTTERPFSAATSSSTIDASPRARGNRRSLFMQSRLRRGKAPAVAGPSQDNTVPAMHMTAFGDVPEPSSYEHDLAVALEHEMLADEASHDNDDNPSVSWELPRGSRPDAEGLPPSPEMFDDDWEYIAGEAARLAQFGSRASGNPFALDPDHDLDNGNYHDNDNSHGIDNPHDNDNHHDNHHHHDNNDTSVNSPPNILYRIMSASTKRSRDRFEATDGNNVQHTLKTRGAVGALLYRNSTPDPKANDIWPEYRSAAKLPARYHLLNIDSPPPFAVPSKPRPQKIVRRSVDKGKQVDRTNKRMPDAPIGRPKWNLPVELVELIAGYLSRDDIKSLRLVSNELNHFVSQVIFKTVVVPFNTEIYGMLVHGQKPDFKGKKRSKPEKPAFVWRNANGDEVYNGHGLDVFKGFGRHILRYGMSFEVNEDSLSQPPVKLLTEKKTSFWGAYEWPFEEYRRFDAVAGLETAADETPRMKIAFSELTRIKELALSVDSGLGWLNGPDRSIRARILQRPPAVFGTLKDVPDRRAQAQQELWGHLEKRHQDAGQDIKLATLYRLDAVRPLSESEEASMIAKEQPEMPYLEPHVVYDATPNDTNEITLPTSFDDPEVLNRFVQTPSSSGAGILFSSITPPTDAGQIMNPIIPANLTKAQKEWLLETEWAQRAFMSSYMLSIIDNPNTFSPVHTLNISRLSDRYLPTLNRADFWSALPNLRDLTIMVIPGWRTVHKDEAGFVDAPRINPITGLDPFCELLSNHVVGHSGIRSLTIGWIGGGEHAEGLYARNKLIMPAPLMPLGVQADNNTVFASDMTTELDATRLRSALLQFPYIEKLTLKNCWVTPAALLQFVKMHDEMSLQSLVLDSVSLTAVLQPNANANQAAPQGGALNIPAPPLAGLLGANAWFNAFNHMGGQVGNPAQAPALPNNNQVLQWLIQSLQVQLQHMQANAGGLQQQNQMAALQTQLQQQIQQLQGQPQVAAPAQHQPLQNLPAQPQIAVNQLAVTALATQVQAMHQQVAAPAQQNFQFPASPQSLLQSQPREGSWTRVIDIISPGTNLGDFNSEHSKANPDRRTSLRSVEFVSCGYAKLPYTAFEQAGLDHGNGIATTIRNQVFSKRYNALAPAMMNAKWAHLGEVVQEVDAAELATLDAGWDLKTGWDDAEEARAVEFDGGLPGGTGRFTGIVRAEDRMRAADEAGPANVDVLPGLMGRMRFA